MKKTKCFFYFLIFHLFIWKYIVTKRYKAIYSIPSMLTLYITKVQISNQAISIVVVPLT